MSAHSMNKFNMNWCHYCVFVYLLYSAYPITFKANFSLFVTNNTKFLYYYYVVRVVEIMSDF